MFSIAAQYYKPIFYGIILFFCVFEALRPAPSLIRSYKKSFSDNSIIFLISIFFIVFLGQRPFSGYYFVDTANYVEIYNNLGRIQYETQKGDVLFNRLFRWFHDQNYSISSFFTFVEFVYIACTTYACFKLFPNRRLAAYIFILASFSYYSFATNGIRNGMATSLFLLALVFAKEEKFTLTILISIIAIGIHNSLYLPVGALIITYFIRSTRFYINAWFLCIFLSLFIGGVMEFVFQNIGFLETGRSFKYLTESNLGDYWERRGYRWDFLLYSAVPIYVGYFFCIKKRFRDTFYTLVLNIYIICNSFWVLVIRAPYTNRFAYLSWFLYGFVVMYPLLTAPYVRHRKRYISFALLGNISFTLLLWGLGR